MTNLAILHSMKAVKYLIIFGALTAGGSRLSGQVVDPKGSVQNGASNRANSRIDQGVDKGLDKIENGIGGLFKKKHKKTDSAAATKPDVVSGKPAAAVTSPEEGEQGHIELKPAGQKLQTFYLSMDVENNWIAGHHVNWETGQPDMPESVHGNKTHCSAFAAAVCKKAGVYLLRPPEHGQVLLANAQFDWLPTPAAQKAGWRKLEGSDRYVQAQTLANSGKIVVAVCKNPDSKEPGHAALVMPKARSLKLLADEGPEVIMAGTHNHNYISLKNGFHSHIPDWPEQEIQFFVEEKADLQNIE